MREALATIVSAEQYLHGSENKNSTLFSFRKHILLKGMKCLGKKNGALLFFALMGLIMQEGLQYLLEMEESVIDTNGRFIILRVLLSGEPALLVNIYGPNRDNELVAFYRSILHIIVNKKFDENENIIMRGDFNCPLNPVIDKRGGNLTPRQSVINAIEQLKFELDLHDIWRVKNPTRRSYTWSQSEPLIFSRLDYWLISNSLSDNANEVDMISSIKTDHSAIVFQDVDGRVKGPGFWKLNCALLNDKQYVNELNYLLPAWLQEGKKDLTAIRDLYGTGLNTMLRNTPDLI